jgi:ligand-binding sensor domain-containing protein/signal transduction histidine kinase/DNA-binding response OmpR family regulator
VQDRKGFMWFGTRDGLNRFDGYTFKTFRHEAGNEHSLGSNYITGTYEDHNGTLWICTTNGLYLYNEKTEDFSLLNVTAGGSIDDVKLDNNNNLWYLSGLNLLRYNLITKKLHSYASADNIRSTSICIANDNIWVSTGNGLIKRYMPETDSFTSFDVFQNSGPTSSKWIKKIFNTGRNSLLIGTSNQGIKLFDIATQTYKDVLTYSADRTAIYARDFIAYDKNEYWIATESGIYIYDMANGSISNLKKQYTDQYSISDNAVYTLCRDKEGGIWAGTYFGGVNYCAKPYAPFQKFYPQDARNAISGNAVREICADRYNNLWIGTEDAGLNKFDPKTGKFSHFKPEGTANSISYSNIHGLLATGDELWIGTFERGLDILNINSGKVVRHYLSNTGSNSSRSNFIITLCQTRSGDILAGTGYGLYQYNKVTGSFDHVKQVIQNDFIYSVIEDHEGTIWTGTLSNGVYYYNPKTKKSGNLRYEGANNKSIGSNAINSIFEDSHNNIWCATEGGGICRLNRQTNTFKRYTSKNGFPSDIIFKVLEDKKGLLWISSTKGLICFNPVTEELKTYTKANGLLTDQFNYNSAYKDAQGRMYFGSVNGMISFNPDQFSNNTFTPPVYITGFQVYNKELAINQNNSPLKTSVTYTDKIQLPYDKSTFSIDFAALSYAAPEMNEYAYKMEGLEDNWNYLKTNRKIYFTNLPAGTYTFLIKGSNSSGIWNNKPTKLIIEILPPFWASTWAYLLYFATAAGIIYYLIRSYHRKTEQKNQQKLEDLRIEKEREISYLENEKEREIYLAKIAFFTNVTHEIRTPLTLIKAPLEKVLKSPDNSPDVKANLEIMKKNTHHLLDLTNQLLDFRKTETTGFSLSFIKTNIADILQETWLRFKPAAEERDLDYTLHLPGDVFAYVDTGAIIKIFSNLFSNAIKYAGSKVHINLAEHHECFSIEVSNDGALIHEKFKEKIFEPFVRLEESETQLGTGIGLPLARSLTELHKGNLNFKPAAGLNIFVLTLPIHQDKEFHLNEEIILPDVLVASQIEAPNAPQLNPVILLVEDHKDILDFIAKELAAEYTILKAHNGREALTLLETATVNLIISDIMMPVMDGLELCKRIKSDVQFSHIPVILLTAKNTLESKIEGLELGADAYIEKPFSPDHLSVQIASLLLNRNNVKEYFARNPLINIKSIAHTKADEVFLEKLNNAIHSNMANTELNIEFLAGVMNMSRPTLFRKIKAISNLSPNDLIKVARLKKAAELLAEADYKIYEVCEMVGYSSQSYFAKSFLSQFGVSPSEYINTISANK